MRRIGRPIKPRPCTCGHYDLIHMGLTGRCLARENGDWADACKGFHEKRKS